MFGLFKNTKPKLTITPDDKEWVETNLIWLGENFGFERVKKTPFYLPTTEHFPYTSIKEDEQFEKLFHQLCGMVDMKRDEFLVTFFDEDNYEFVVGDWDNTDALYEKIKQGNKKYKVAVSNNNFSDIERLISSIVHILIQIKLVEGKFIGNDDEDMKGLIDLAAIFFGFGIFLANGSTRTHKLDTVSYSTYGVSRVGYLPDKVIAYANALVCKIAEKEHVKYIQCFNSNTKTSFENNYNYLTTTGNTQVNKKTISLTNEIFCINKSLTYSFNNKDYHKALKQSKELIQINSEKPEAWNNLGYAYLMLGDFNKAIQIFNEAIKIDICWDIPFSNRAYCKIQTNELESAYIDIKAALEFDSGDSYVLRNIGIFNLAKKEYETALEYLLKAYELDETTDLIHFYLAKVYEKLADTKKQIFHHEKSAELNETTLSFLQSYKY